MIKVDDALALVLSNVSPRAAVKVPLAEAQGLVLAEDMLSDLDMPPFDKSAMDGFAVIAADTDKAPVELEIVEELPAGSVAKKPIGSGQAAKIMTGAAVLQGADAVVMVEDTEPGHKSSFVRVLKPVKKGKNICFKAEDMKRGDRVAAKGAVLRPQEIGVLAAVGAAEVLVHPAPSIAILSTGDELVKASEKPQPGQIRDSNSFSLRAQALRLTPKVQVLGIARDKRAELQRLIRKGLGHDIFILSGGISVGEFDLCGRVLKELGVNFFFEKVAIRPGRPTAFGKKDGTLVFALPGNPVSSLVTFELFVRPAVQKLMGCSRLGLPRVRASVTCPVAEKNGRTRFVPAVLRWSDGKWAVTPVEWHGSADIRGLTQANALMILVEGVEKLSPGEQTEVLVLDEADMGL
ncbi:MAG: molybdopterin molybdotransferase MoeA [Planctomycetes bacterium]|nr:molybdopterin molybdotransferase MoeA [Planctomycetota bacterium]